MKRILFVVNVDWFFLSHRWPIARALMGQGVDVHLAAGPTPAAQQTLTESGVTTHEVAFSRQGRSPVELARLGRHLVDLQRVLGPDLTHNVTVKPVLVSSVASRLGGSPPVVNAISGFGHLLAEGESSRAVRAATLSAYRLALRAPRRSRVIFQNDVAMEQFVSRRIVRSDDARLISGMGVDPDIFHPPVEEPSQPVVMLVGRMIRSKGIAEFVTAASAIRRAVPEARCVLVGPTDEGNPLAYGASELRELESSGSIEYWGPTDDVAEVMRRSTVQVLPTYHEGLPKTLLEAAATGRGIVATDIPGCRVVIADGQNGRLVPPRDALALADAVIRLLEDNSQRERLAAAARQTVLDDFTVEHAVQQHLVVYAELLT